MTGLSHTLRQDGTKLDSADETAELTLVLTKKARKKASKALKKGGKAKVKGGKAKVKGVVKVTDDSFNVTKQRFEIGFR